MAEEDPWGFDEGDTDFTPTSKVGSRAGTPSSAKVAGGSMAGGSLAGDVAADARPVMDSADEGNYRKPLTLNKHWVRPRFLQYNYMYDYRHNYYNDVIDYLDMRNRGLKPEVPRAQTWAERVLRTHSRPTISTSGGYDVYDSYLTRKDGTPRLIQTLSSSIKPTNYHSRAYLFRKYASVL